MSNLGEIGDFINYVKNESNKPITTSRMAVYQKVLKELKQEDRKVLLEIIKTPKNTPEKPQLASRIKQLTSEIQGGNFKSNRKTGSWASFCRIMKNIFSDRVSSRKLLSNISKSSDFNGKVQDYKAPEAILFKKGEKKTQEVIPRNKKEVLGKGAVGGTVYTHGKNSNIAVKPGSTHEYEIGATLDHPNIAKTYQLYTKKYDKKLDKNLLAMEKVKGKTMTEYYQTGKVLSNNEATELLSQAKDCVSYLFDQNVIWKDVNDGNIFIEDKTGNLKIIDFGFWNKEQDPKKKGLDLLFGSMEVAGWVIRNTAQGKNKDPSFRSEVLFPKEFFGDEIDYLQIISYASGHYSELPWVKNVQAKLESMTEEEMKNFVASYFDYVIHNFQQSLR